MSFIDIKEFHRSFKSPTKDKLFSKWDIEDRVFSTIRMDLLPFVGKKYRRVTVALRIDWIDVEEGEKNRETYTVSFPYGAFGISVEDGVVVEAAPMGKWMLGKTLSVVRGWVGKKGGSVTLEKGEKK